MSHVGLLVFFVRLRVSLRYALLSADLNASKDDEGTKITSKMFVCLL